MDEVITRDDDAGMDVRVVMVKLLLLWFVTVVLLTVPSTVRRLLATES